MMRPSTPFDDLFDRMARQFDEMSHERGLDAIRQEMSLDVSERDDEFVVTADIPGFEKADIDLSISGRTLTIAADREVESEDDTAEYIRRERTHRSLRRSVRLPAEVREGETAATYRNGVLTVSLPKLGSDDDRHRIDID